MPVIPSFDNNSVQAICDILAETETGLSNAEMDRLLQSSDIPNIEPVGTKRLRLANILASKQKTDRCANNIVLFIQNVMDPIRYAKNRASFESRRAELNLILSLRGFEISIDGKMRAISKVSTLSAADLRARGLKRDLSARGIHTDVLKFCRAELLQDNYFHAVLEATKSVADKIRAKSGLAADGAELVDEAFSIKLPLLALSRLETESEKSEQKGFAMLLKGMFGTFRNPAAHEAKIKWPIDEQDALDLLSMVSYAHRRLDSVIVTGLILDTKQ